MAAPTNMAEAPSRFMNSEHLTHPDDDSVKEVWIQAAGLVYSGVVDRHVMLWWLNGTYEVESDVMPTTQVVQLTGNTGNYHYYCPVVKKRSRGSATSNQQWSLTVQFTKTSTVNDCRVWTRDLLEAMVSAGLLSAEVFTTIDQEAPLVRRQPEV
ncbi:hypothetical protein BDN72DRAFT_890428 [Pluteus cervinus]|uniref:Uncharacterized protein n=1 Tax=Pluteus cervinus TaxID=181527 RepID=A0ACD2ZYM2_9AGAR|nr:hypothetical protein BDN72DRAFT_890428 [Pluteus cervinus]